MRSTSGKTFRYIDRGPAKDTSLTVKSKDEFTLLRGFEFHGDLKYSLNKKQRWQLLDHIASQSDDDEEPIMHIKHQCVFNDTPLLDVYLYDSISKTKMGYFNVSNRFLNGRTVNVDSAIHQLENRHNYTAREKKVHVKMKRRRLRSGNVAEVDELPTKEEHLRETELRRNCVNVHEFVNLQNLSTVNWVHSYNYRYWRDSRARKHFTSKDISDDDFEYNEEPPEPDKMEVVADKRPFVITGEDFRCVESKNSPKRKRKRNKRSFRQCSSFSERAEPMNAVENGENVGDDVYDDQLSMIDINTSRDKFEADLRSIVVFFKCWRNVEGPSAVLIDLDESEESRDKSFIVIRPMEERDENSLSVRVILNVGNRGLCVNEVSADRFVGVIDVVTFVQSKLIRGTSGRSPISNLVLLNGSVSYLNNLPQAKAIGNPHSLYIYHEEWIQCVLNSGNLDSFIKEIEHFDYAMEECGMCAKTIVDYETILIKECQHRTCEECLSLSIVDQMSRNVVVITCPYQDCATALDAPLLLSSISWKRYRHRLDALEEKLMGKAGKACIKCGAILIQYESSGNKMKHLHYQCHCGSSVCFNCGQLPHSPSSCEEMKRHNHKLALPPKLTIAMIKPTLQYHETCASCDEVIPRWDIDTKLTCLCLKVFCPRCTIACSIHKSSCQDDVEPKRTFPNSSQIVPIQNPQSAGLKLYNQSVYLHFLRRSDNLSIFKCDISRFASMSLVTRPDSFSAHELTALYSQILRILESMYVAAYNSYKKDNPKKLQLLKVSTSHLLFCVGRIQMVMDEIRAMVLPRGRTAVKDKIGLKYHLLQSHICDARLFTKKILSLLDL